MHHGRLDGGVENEHGESTLVPLRANDGSQWQGGGGRRCRLFPKRHRRDHAGLEQVVGIRHGDLNLEHMAARVGSASDARDVPQEGLVGEGVAGDRGFATQTEATADHVGNADDQLHRAHIGQREHGDSGRGQGPQFQVAAGQRSGEGRANRRVAQHGRGLVEASLGARDAGQGGIQSRADGVELCLGNGVSGHQLFVAIEIQLGLVAGHQGFGMGGVGFGQAIGEIGFAQGRELAVLRDRIAFLNQARLAIGTFDLGDAIHVTAHLERQVNPRGSVDAG